MSSRDDSERGKLIVSGPSVDPDAAVNGCQRSGDRSARCVTLIGMIHRVGAKGQVVIPKDLRDELGIEPGDEVSFWRDGDHVALRPTRHARPLRGRFAGAALVDELAADRQADRR